ncbi:MAG: hypothetical protein OT477_06055 [Chloroflexi bacterium]|nr:hypothetical protein [Chloroflexota bacterium]
MSDTHAKELFAKIDYTLRAGVHIQRQYRGQQEIFRFVQKYRDSLDLYYKNFFSLSLQSGGQGDQEYFFIERNNDEANQIPSNSKNRLKPEFLIIGIFLCKLFYIDFSEIETVTNFKKALKEEYEPFKADFYRLFAYSKSNKYTTADDEAVEQQVDKAFREFDRLGWIKLEEDYFEIMPSLERLRLLYENEIRHIDDFMRSEEEYG